VRGRERLVAARYVISEKFSFDETFGNSNLTRSIVTGDTVSSYNTTHKQTPFIFDRAKAISFFLQIIRNNAEPRAAVVCASALTKRTIRADEKRAPTFAPTGTGQRRPTRIVYTEIEREI